MEERIRYSKGDIHAQTLTHLSVQAFLSKASPL
jgi:hypothetical protein